MCKHDTYDVGACWATSNVSELVTVTGGGSGGHGSLEVAVCAAVSRAALVEVSTVWLEPTQPNVHDDADVARAVRSALSQWRIVRLDARRPERVHGRVTPIDAEGRSRVHSAGRFHPGQLVEVKDDGERRIAVTLWCDPPAFGRDRDFVVWFVDSDHAQADALASGSAATADLVQVGWAVFDAVGSVRSAAAGLLGSTGVRRLFADRLVTVLSLSGWGLGR
jgi:hypothetical protein